MKNDFEIRGDKVAIFLNRRDGTALETIIDKEDLDRAQEYQGTWYSLWSPCTNSFYARSASTKEGKTTAIHFHRWISRCPIGLEVDHINHDTLDNTRANIRNVTIADNNQNVRKRVDNISGFSGVSWHKGANKWKAQINIENRRTHLGLFNDIRQAANAVHLAKIENMPGYAYEGMVINQ